MSHFESGTNTNQESFTAPQDAVVPDFLGEPQIVEANTANPNIFRKSLMSAGGLIAAFALANCGGGDGQETTIGNSPTAVSAESKTPLVVSLTAEPTKTPTEAPAPTATPEPEKVVTQEEVAEITAFASQNFTGQDKKYIDSLLTQGADFISQGDKAHLESGLNKYGNAAKMFSDRACANPDDSISAEAFKAARSYVLGTLDKKIAEGVFTVATKNLITQLHFTIPPDCKNPVLIPLVK